MKNENFGESILSKSELVILRLQKFFENHIANYALSFPTPEHKIKAFSNFITNRLLIKKINKNKCLNFIVGD